MAIKRFYKFSELYNLFVNKFGTLTNIVTDFTVGSVMRALAQTVVFFVSFLQLQIKIAYESFRVATAKGSDLDTRIADWQMTRGQAAAAQGVIKFMANAAAEADFIIPAGTIVSTEEDVYGLTIDYSLDSDLIFPSGATSVTGEITCVETGRIGNVASGKITNITSPIAGVDSITNPEPTSSGAEDETDEQLRKRLPLRIIGLQTGNESAILNAAYSVPGVTYAKVLNNSPTNGHFTLYFSTYSGIVDSALRVRVKEAVDRVADFCIVANYAIPAVINVDVSMTLNIDTETYASGVVTGEVRDAIYDFIQLNNANELKISDLIVIAKSIAGVLDVSSVTIDGSATNKSVSSFEVIKVDSLNDITFTVT